MHIIKARFLFDDPLRGTQGAEGEGFAAGGFVRKFKAFAWSRNRETAGLGQIAFAHGAAVLGVCLVAAREAIPPIWSYLGGNCLIALAATELLTGTRRFYGRSSDRTLRWGSLTLVTGSFVYFLYLSPNLVARVVVLSAVLAVLLSPRA